jgi:hypothetical protein
MKRSSFPKRSHILIFLTALAIFDAVIPIPVAAMALIALFFHRPRWFKDWIEEIYRA